MHNHIQPYAAICSLVQPCSYIHQDASIYSHMSPYEAISVNGAKLCQSARGAPSSPLARFNTIWHYSPREFRYLLTRFRALELHTKHCKTAGLLHYQGRVDLHLRLYPPFPYPPYSATLRLSLTLMLINFSPLNMRSLRAIRNIISASTPPFHTPYTPLLSVCRLRSCF